MFVTILIFVLWDANILKLYCLEYYTYMNEFVIFNVIIAIVFLLYLLLDLFMCGF